MKNTTLALFLLAGLCWSQHAHCIGSYAVKDTLHVLTLAGLKLRTGPKLASGVKGLLPYGSFVVVKGLTTTKDSIPEAEGYGIEGSWVKVTTKHGEGFVFDGYLSHFLPPKITEKGEKGNTIESYIEECYRPLSKKMPASKHPQEFNQVFSQGIRFSKRVAPDSSAYGRIMIQEISLEETFLITNIICRTESGDEPVDYGNEQAVLIKKNGNEVFMEPVSGNGLAVRIIREEKKGGGGGVIIQYRYLQQKKPEGGNSKK